MNRIRLKSREGGKYGVVHYAIYELEENTKCHSSEEKRINSIRYLLSNHLCEYIQILYECDLNQNEIGFEEFNDYLTSETSEEEFKRVIARLEEKPCSIETTIHVNDEEIDLSLCLDGEIYSFEKCCSEFLFSEEVTSYNKSETVWYLEDYFNKKEALYV